MEENKLGRKRSCLQLPTCSPRKLQVLVAGCWQNFSFHKLIYCCWFWNYFRSTGSLVVICFVWQKVQNLERTTHDPFQKCRTCTEKSSHKKLFSRIVVFFFLLDQSETICPASVTCTIAREMALFFQYFD